MAGTKDFDPYSDSNNHIGWRPIMALGSALLAAATGCMAVDVSNGQSSGTELVENYPEEAIVVAESTGIGTQVLSLIELNSGTVEELSGEGARRTATFYVGDIDMNSASVRFADSNSYFQATCTDIDAALDYLNPQAVGPSLVLSDYNAERFPVEKVYIASEQSTVCKDMTIKSDETEEMLGELGVTAPETFNNPEYTHHYH